MGTWGDIHAMLPGSKLKSIALCVILALCLHSTEGDVSDQNQAVSHREKGRGGFLAATGSFRLSGLVPREEERSLGERNVVPHTIASWCAAHHLKALQPALEELGDSVHDLSLLTQEDIAHMQLKPLTARRLTAALKSSTLDTKERNAKLRSLCSILVSVTQLLLEKCAVELRSMRTPTIRTL